MDLRTEHLVGRAHELACSSRSSTSSVEAGRVRSSWWASQGSARRGCSESSALALSCADTSFSRDRPRSSSASCRSTSSSMGWTSSSRPSTRSSSRPSATTSRRSSRRLPSLSGLATLGDVALQHERYRSHRAVRATGAACGNEAARARARRLHWADPASGRAPRRAAAPAACGCRAHRSGAPPSPDAGTSCTRIRAGARAAALTRIELDALTPVEARAFSAGPSTRPRQPSSTRRAAATPSTSSSSPDRTSVPVRPRRLQTSRWPTSAFRPRSPPR